MLLKEPPSYLPAVNKVAMTASYFTTGENKSKQSPFWKCIDFMHNSDMCHLTTILVPLGVMRRKNGLNILALDSYPCLNMGNLRETYQYSLNHNSADK